MSDLSKLEIHGYCKICDKLYIYGNVDPKTASIMDWRRIVERERKRSIVCIYCERRVNSED